MIIHCIKFNPIKKLKKLILSFFEPKQLKNAHSLLTQRQLKLYDLIKHKSRQRVQYNNCLYSLYTKITDYEKGYMTFELLERMAIEDSVNQITSILHNMYNVESYEDVFELLTTVKNPNMIKFIFALWRYINIIFARTSNTWRRSLTLIHAYLIDLPQESLCYIKTDEILSLTKVTQYESAHKDIQLIYLKVMLNSNVDLIQKIEIVKILTYDRDLYPENLAFLNQEYERLMSLMLPEVIDYKLKPNQKTSDSLTMGDANEKAGI